ncbi:MAG: hypothetical protein RIQ93_865 [Verrucomicrobiota bacterium]|jgi:L-seryl-tRNA(Ser) seleniumtransferase
MPERPPSSAGRDAFRDYGLTRVINVSGTETGKGAGPVCAEVISAVSALVPHWVDMLELQSVASRTIAATFGSEAGLVAHCSAAGMSTAIAAAMTGTDLGRAERLPDTTGLKNRVILQRGHNVNYGAPTTQSIRLTGAEVVEIGAATECLPRELEAAIDAQTAAALFVVSHHTAPSGMIPLATFCAICRRHKVPVIVDAAAEPDPRAFVAAGADMVITSLHKQFGGLTSATLAGKLEFIRACQIQEKGLARAMKVGKEGVIGAIVALERWAGRDRAAGFRRADARVLRGARQLAKIPGLHATGVVDATSRLFSRLHVQVDEAKLGRSASALAAALLAGNPSIMVRTQFAAEGLLQLDFRHLSDEVAEQVVERVAEEARRPAQPAGKRRASGSRLQAPQFPLPRNSRR